MKTWIRRMIGFAFMLCMMCILMPIQAKALQYTYSYTYTFTKGEYDSKKVYGLGGRAGSPLERYGISDGELPPGIKPSISTDDYYLLQGTPTEVGTYEIELEFEYGYGSNYSGWVTTVRCTIHVVEPTYKEETMLCFVGDRMHCEVGAYDEMGSYDVVELGSGTLVDSWISLGEGDRIYVTGIPKTAGEDYIKFRFDDNDKIEYRTFNFIMAEDGGEVSQTIEWDLYDNDMEYLITEKYEEDVKSLTLVSGKMPNGVKAIYGEDTFLRGVPTEEGTFTAKYKAEFQDGKVLYLNLKVVVNGPDQTFEKTVNVKLGSFFNEEIDVVNGVNVNMSEEVKYVGLLSENQPDTVGSSSIMEMWHIHGTPEEEGEYDSYFKIVFEDETVWYYIVHVKVYENQFTDVKKGDWFYNSVLWAVNNKITSGLTETLFGPDVTCSRAQAVTFMWRAAGSPAPNNQEMPFSDVPDGAYYYKAVQWAVENKITAGLTATLFAPDAYCTRGQIVSFLWRGQGSPQVSSANPFTDVASNAYYYKAVLWAVENKITAGITPTTFCPDAYCTRAQIVAFLHRSAEKALKISVQPNDVLCDPSTNVFFSVEAKGGKEPYTYQWEYANDSFDFEPITEEDKNWASGYNKAELSIYVINDDFDEHYRYRCVVTDADGRKAVSQEAKPIRKTPVITVHPKSVAKDNDGYVTFTTAAEGGTGGYSYQWQCRDKNGNIVDLTSANASTNNVTIYRGYNTNTLKILVTMDIFTYGYQYRCVVIDSAGNQTMTGFVDVLPSLSIQTQPVDSEAVFDEIAVFEVAVTGGNAPYTYQWEYRRDNASYYYAVDNGSSKRLQVKVGLYDYLYNYKYRCVITDASGNEVTTKDVGFIGTPEKWPLYVEEISDSCTIKAGQSTTISVKAAGGTAPYSYRWEKYDYDSETWSSAGSGRSKTVYTPSGEYSTNTYRCIITDSEGNKVTSREVMVLGDKEYRG